MMKPVDVFSIHVVGSKWEICQWSVKPVRDASSLRLRSLQVEAPSTAVTPP